MSPTENCSRTRSPQKKFPRRLLGELCLETLIPRSSFLALFLSFLPHHFLPRLSLCRVPSTSNPPYHGTHTTAPGTLTMWILNCSRLEPLLSLTETPSFYHRTPTIYARNMKYQLSILDMTKYPYCLNWNYYFLGLAERHQTISCVWEA